MKPGAYGPTWPWLLLALGALGVTPAAYAGEGAASSALVLPAQVEGAAAGDGKAWDTRIAEHLSVLGIEPLSDEVSATEASCGNHDCLSAIAKVHHADLVARAIVTETSGRLQLRLVLLRAGEAAPREEEGVCADCSLTEAAVRLNEMLDRALALRGDAGGSSEEFQPRLKLWGDDDSAQHSEAPIKNRPAWLNAADGALAAGIALGLVGVGFGAAALHYNGVQACTPAPGQIYCPRVGQTLPLGVGLTVGGAVLALGAASAIVALELRLGRPQAPAMTVRLSPLVGTNMAGLTIGGAL